MKTSKPYFAVIFTSTLKSSHGYGVMAQKMEQLAREQVGFLGVDSSRSDIGITVSYWETLEAISNWKSNIQHLNAQNKGKKTWYEWYNVKICKVLNEYDFNSLQ